MSLTRLVLAAKTFLQIRSNPIDYARSLGVTVGRNCRFLDITRNTFGSEPYLITIGNHVTITSRVQFITHDGGVWVFRDEAPNLDVVAPVRIGNNVFLGFGSIIMPGVIVGDNCVVGAGSIVTKDIPSNTVAAGVPARVIMTTEEYRQSCLKKGLSIKDFTRDEKREVLTEFYKSEPR